MSWASVAAGLSRACAATFGESVVYTASDDSETTCDCVISRRAEPVLRGGMLVIMEDHYDGHIPQASLSAAPAIGDTITTAAGVVYRVDVPPELRDGMWALVLRRTVDD